MTARIVLVLDGNERRALGLLAKLEMREPRDQARFILRAELERRGLLPDELCHTAVPPTHTAVTQGVQHDPD